MPLPQLSKLDAISKRAIACSVCFESLQLRRPTVAIAQPRFVGPKYWSSKPRVLIVTLNPGSGASRTDSADAKLDALLKDYAGGRRTLDDVFAHQREDMPYWGKGRFGRFYFAGLGVRADSLAFVNVAWCATAGNKYPPQMLSNCFARHTQELIGVLDPQVVLLSGSDTHKFAPAITGHLPSAKVITTLHYAHREGAGVERQELQRIRRELVT